jgi:hypothetical protein
LAKLESAAVKDADYREPTPQCRESFELAWGMSVGEQLQLEGEIRQLRVTNGAGTADFGTFMDIGGEYPFER